MIVLWLAAGCGTAASTGGVVTVPEASVEVVRPLGDVTPIEVGCREHDFANAVDEDCDRRVDEAASQSEPHLGLFFAWNRPASLAWIIRGPGFERTVEAGCGDPRLARIAVASPLSAGTYEVEVEYRSACEAPDAPMLTATLSVSTPNESHGPFNVTLSQPERRALLEIEPR